jgi:hypothetical protein
MAQEAQHNTTSPADVYRAAEAVARNGRRQVVRVHGTAVALVPQAEPKPKPRRRTPYLTRDGSLWSVVGAITEASGPTDISANKHTYLTEAYLDHHE